MYGPPRKEILGVQNCCVKKGIIVKPVGELKKKKTRLLCLEKK